ncbi:Plasmodesmata callose-binding protein 3 [Quillaja saponaria]|uniref:Plasmodesmata callose-binding protein 3 n=1 Tax=Quillaja saponaria TaxID=32244 RepID=A0AAD7P6B2_QUISA|nr:Plasmodesmata callose-binding protein 3 [Quillaja saponaria]
MAILVCLVIFLALTGHSSATYCVCKDGLSDQVLQKSLDYACGAGADCTPIEQKGACYNPNTVKDHCNYAVNSYFQNKGQAQGSCDFSGTAMVSQTPPSTASSSGCVYPTSPGTGTTTPGTSPPSTTTPGTSPPSTTTPGTSPPSTTTPGTSPPSTTTPGTTPPSTTTPGTTPSTTTPGSSPTGTGSTTSPTGNPSIFGVSPTGSGTGFDNSSDEVSLFKSTNSLFSLALALTVWLVLRV